MALDKNPRHLAQRIGQVDPIAELATALRVDGRTNLRLGQRGARGGSDDLLAFILRLENHVLFMAVHGAGIEAEAGNLLEVGCGDEDVEPPAGAAADLVGAIDPGQRQGQNLAILHQHHACVDNRLAQRVGDGAVHDRRLG